MRVLFISRGFPHYTIELTGGLVRTGHTVASIMREQNDDWIGGGDENRNAMFRELLDPRVESHLISISDGNSPRSLIANVGAIARIRSIIRRFNPDIVHMQDESDYRIYAAAVWRLPRQPIVLTVHDAQLHPGYRKNRTAFIRSWLKGKADAIVVHGEEIKQRLVAGGEIPASKVHVIPHGSNIMYRRWLTGDTAGSDRNVLFFGRVLLYKGLEYLIKAAPLVWQEVPDAKFVIAGSGPDWSRIRPMITDPERFILRDENVPEPDVTRLFEKCAMLVLPYIEASQSGVLATAFAMAKPSIVTNVGSLPEVVQDGVTGFVVPPKDEKALANAIIRLLKDTELREIFGRNTYDVATKGKLSWDDIARKNAAVYQMLADRRRGKKGD